MRLLPLLLAAAAADYVDVEPQSLGRRASRNPLRTEADHERDMTYEGSSERRRRKKEKQLLRDFPSVGDTDVGDNAELKNLKELAICAAGLGARQATFQDANTHSLVLAGSLVSDVKKLLDLGVPLHATFLANVQLAAAAVYRVGWWMSNVLSSPYFHFFQTTSLELLQWTLETQITATNARADAPHIEQGERSVGALAVRAAQKTVGLMKEWKILAKARIDQIPEEEVELTGVFKGKNEGHNARKAKLFDDISEAEEKVALQQSLKETNQANPDEKNLERPKAGMKEFNELLSMINDPETAELEQQLQHAFVQTGKIPLLPVSEYQFKAGVKGHHGKNADGKANTDGKASLLQLDEQNGTATAVAAAAVVLAAKAPAVANRTAAAPSLSHASRALTRAMAELNATSMSLTAHRRRRGDDGEGVNASARAAQLTRAQTAILTVNKVRFGLGKMQQMMANLAISTAALKDNLACVREELDESMESSAFVPRWIIKTYGILTFAGSIVWRMLMAMLASRTSLYTMASRFLHASDTYALLLWQGLVANAAQLSPLGPYGAGMPGARLELDDVKPGLILPG